MKFLVEWTIAIFVFWIVGLGHSLAKPDIERYVDNKDGTVEDKQTGLVWQKMDSYHDLKKPISWYGAHDYVDKKNREKFAGYDDWRLPTMSELKSIWDPSKPNFTKDEQKIGLPRIFPSGGSYYLWASNERGLDMAWYLGLGQKEDYFNLKEANDLGQGVKLVRE